MRKIAQGYDTFEARHVHLIVQPDKWNNNVESNKLLWNSAKSLIKGKNRSAKKHRETNLNVKSLFLDSEVREILF